MATTRASNQFQGLQTKARYLRASNREKRKCKPASESARGREGESDREEDSGRGKGREGGREGGERKEALRSSERRCR